MPHLRAAYQKLSFNNKVGASSVGGFGFTHDGTDPTLTRVHNNLECCLGHGQIGQPLSHRLGQSRRGGAAPIGELAGQPLEFTARGRQLTLGVL